MTNFNWKIFGSNCRQQIFFLVNKLLATIAEAWNRFLYMNIHVYCEQVYIYM